MLNKFNKVVAFFILLTCSLINNVFAKKVKFVVDMSAETVSVFGVHVMGNFQSAGGFGADFTPNTCTMTLASASTYEFYADLPAFQTYQYIFLNGDQSYETESVPNICQVDYFETTNDNRWFYLDSLADDTTVVGGMKYAGTAPANKNILRLMLDMSGQSSGNDIPHVGGNFNTWNYKAQGMSMMATAYYDIILYLDPGMHEFRFTDYNGIPESFAGNCLNANSNRYFQLSADTALYTFLFNTCNKNGALSINTNQENTIQIYPNPTANYLHIFTNNEVEQLVRLVDGTGRLMLQKKCSNNEILDLSNFSAGIYFVQINSTSYKIIKQ